MKPAADDTPMKPQRASRTKAKNKKRTPSPSLSSSSDESICSTSPEKERKKKDPAKRYARMRYVTKIRERQRKLLNNYILLYCTFNTPKGAFH